jgi:hypothetical protein
VRTPVYNEHADASCIPLDVDDLIRIEGFLKGLDQLHQDYSVMVEEGSPIYVDEDCVGEVSYELGRIHFKPRVVGY